MQKLGALVVAPWGLGARVGRVACLTVLAVSASIGASCEGSRVSAPSDRGSGAAGNGASSSAPPAASASAGNGARGGNGDAGTDGLPAAGADLGGGANAGGSIQGLSGAAGSADSGGATMGGAGQGGGDAESLMIAQVAAGSVHTCARLSSGRLLCWGSISSGQLCIPGLDGTQRTPLEVPNAESAIFLGVGSTVTCFVDELGDVSCCGNNFDGQVNGAELDTPQYDTPTTVPGIEGASSVAVGYYHSCAVVGAGEVRCWGLNSLGMLGNNEIGNSPVFPPVTVENLSDAAAVSLGRYFSCALRRTGAVQCWGSGSVLGAGTHPDSAIPVDTGDADFQAIAIDAGDDHACVLHSTGKVSCWGANRDFQLGIGTGKALEVTTPTEVIGVEGATGIAAGGCHTCARLESGSVACWGCNASGQLGLGDTDDRSTAVVIPEFGPVKAIEAGYDSTCAALESGGLACWGNNVDGRLVGGAATIVLSPVLVSRFGR